MLHLNILSSSWHFCVYFWEVQAFLLQLKCHMTFWVDPLHPESASSQILEAMGLGIVETKHF